MFEFWLNLAHIFSYDTEFYHLLLALVLSPELFHGNVKEHLLKVDIGSDAFSMLKHYTLHDSPLKAPLNQPQGEMCIVCSVW